MNWYLKFMAVAEAFAAMSKDPSTKVGAIALTDNRIMISSGYNGFPRGVNDSAARYEDRTTKYALVSHAEANLVAQAAYSGHSLKDSTVLVTPLHPCASCAKLLVQAGVKRVISPVPHIEERWKQESEWASTIFTEAGVEVVFVEKVGGAWRAV